MSSTPRTRNDRGATTGDPRCVWMTAGILSYQLCERGLDCDACPLDAALRRHFGQPAPAPEAVAGSPAEPGLPAGRAYARNHLWLLTTKRTPDGHREVRVGLEPGLAAAFPGVRAVVLPAVGERLHRGRVHLWIVTAGGTFPVAAPTDGVVVAVNAELRQGPHRVPQDPLHSGWLFAADVCDYEWDGAALVEPLAAEALWREESRRFQERLVAALGGERAEVGATLADGGVPLDRLADMLGAARYFGLLQTSYG